MATEKRIPKRVWAVLDGHFVGRGFGSSCPGCGREHAPGDRLVVTTERPSDAVGWTVPSVVCSECGQRSVPEGDRREGVDQLLVSVEVAPAPMTLVLDGETATVLDRSPRNDGSPERTE